MISSKFYCQSLLRFLQSTQKILILLIRTMYFHDRRSLAELAPAVLFVCFFFSPDFSVCPFAYNHLKENLMQYFHECELCFLIFAEVSFTNWHNIRAYIMQWSLPPLDRPLLMWHYANKNCNAWGCSTDQAFFIADVVPCWPEKHLSDRCEISSRAGATITNLWRCFVVLDLTVSHPAFQLHY